MKKILKKLLSKQPSTELILFLFVIGFIIFKFIVYYTPKNSNIPAGATDLQNTPHDKFIKSQDKDFKQQR